jgi:hypothetical protein
MSPIPFFKYAVWRNGIKAIVAGLNYKPGNEIVLFDEYEDALNLAFKYNSLTGCV